MTPLPGAFALLRLFAAALLVALLPGLAAAASLQVHPGDSIQAAIDRAAPGDVIEIHRGRYV